MLRGGGRYGRVKRKAKNSAMHTEKRKPAKTRVPVVGAGAGGSGWERIKPGAKTRSPTKMNPKTMQHVKKKTGENPVFSPVFWQGQKDLNPRHAVLETAALPTELYPYVKFCLIILSFSKVVVNGFFKIFLRVSKNRGECCFSSYLAVSAKNTVLFGETQPSVKERNPLNRRSTMKKHCVSVYLSPEISGSYRKVGPNPTEIPRAAMGKLAL